MFQRQKIKRRQCNLWLRDPRKYILCVQSAKKTINVYQDRITSGFCAKMSPKDLSKEFHRISLLLDTLERYDIGRISYRQDLHALLDFLFLSEFEHEEIADTHTDEENEDEDDYGEIFVNIET